jgi:NADH-quinone oxidoreductase subunit L
MEGPTPVSALIHAATMVAAGVYLVARLFPIFEASDQAMNTVAIIGGTTALVAATMGIVMTDIKRVVAYSTISQLGYMMMGLGVGGFAAAIFHLFNHAFFKALLFLGAGSVNHATNTFDMRLMGGLRRHMPWTFATFTVAALSLGGIFPLSGFWSKDEIIADAWDEKRLLALLGLGVAFMTALYIGRVVFLTFGGEYRGGAPAAGHHEPSRFAPHESPWVMLGPMVFLALGAIFSGLFNLREGVSDLLNGSLPAEVAEAHEGAGFKVGIAASSVALALGGFFVAWAIYGARLVSADAVRRAFGPIHQLVANKYYLDWLYEDIIVKRVFIGGISRGLDLFDRYVVDGTVNATAWTTNFTAQRLRLAQAGQLQIYGAAIVVGVVLITLGILIVNP